MKKLLLIPVALVAACYGVCYLAAKAETEVESWHGYRVGPG